MSVRLLAVAFAAEEPATLAGFWADLLGREVVDDVHGPLVTGDATQLGLRFVTSHGNRTGLNTMHVHLTSESSDQQRDTVAKALRLGARHLDVGQLPEEEHIVLADPEGNEFCVIEAGNSFLAGCGFLGELACDGGRDVGVFWSEALQWPLVWDEDEETAIQSPHGGTKVAWGGPPVRPATDRQHFELVGAHDEVDRLLALGATRVGGDGDVITFTDPGGTPFRLLR